MAAQGGSAAAAADLGYIVPSAIVDLEVMYEAALPPPYFHRVVDGSGSGVNLAAGSTKNVSLWFAQHSDKEGLGKAPVVAVTVVHNGAAAPEGFTLLSKEILRQGDGGSKAHLAVKRRAPGGTELGLGAIAATYGEATPGALSAAAPPCAVPDVFPAALLPAQRVRGGAKLPPASTRQTPPKCGCG